MLKLAKLGLLHFRNYSSIHLQLVENIVCISGNNGSGKTNLLDAIYYLSVSRSYFSRPDAASVSHNAAGMKIEGEFEMNDQQHNVKLILRENLKKEFSLDDVPYRKLSDHIGKFPCVMIAPDDVELITGQSADRRKFLDAVLSQINHNYLEALIDYNKVLLQRNSFLKSVSEGAAFNSRLVQVFDEQLHGLGTKIFEIRKRFLAEFFPMVIANYRTISGGDETISLNYVSDLMLKPFNELLKEAVQKDVARQRTTVGIHKDDIEFLFGPSLFKSVASQGQRKSLLFALKLAEFSIINAHKKFAPILLLDDVFEKLDEQRLQSLLNFVCRNLDAQVFITDTHRSRLRDVFERMELRFQEIVLDSFSHGIH